MSSCTLKISSEYRSINCPRISGESCGLTRFLPVRLRLRRLRSLAGSNGLKADLIGFGLLSSSCTSRLLGTPDKLCLRDMSGRRSSPTARNRKRLSGRAKRYPALKKAA